MDKAYLIRKYEERDKGQVISLYKKVFGEEAALGFERRWLWQFIDNPARKDTECSNVVAESESSIIGHMGFFPALLKVNEKNILCYWGSDLMVDPDHRKKGIAKKLYGQLGCLGSPAAFLMGLSKVTEKIARLNKWEECKVDTASIRVLNFKAVKGFLLSAEKPYVGPFGILFVLGIILGEALNLFKSLKHRRPSENINIFSPSSFDERFDEFWNKVSLEYPIISLRNTETLNWRFIKNPNYRYNIISAEKNNKITGYIVTYVKKVNSGSIGYIIDFLTLPEEKTSSYALAREAVKYLRSQNAELIISIGLSEYQRKALRENRFTSNLLIQKYLRPKFFFKTSDEMLFNKALSKNPHDWFISNFDYDLFM
ncbi:MAG: GNAT family N-acetyltransferase [Candidatus Omnitrophota bacterium]